MVFHDRADAGRQLAAALASLTGPIVILAIPAGGVPVGYEIAKALRAPLDLCLAHKIGAPGNPEFAIGSVDASGNLVLDDVAIATLSISRRYIAEAASREREALAVRMERYRGDLPALELAGKLVVVVDDGLATGATALAALKSLAGAGAAKRLFAAPVASAEAIVRISPEADDVVVLYAPSHFGAVGQFYKDFSQVGEEEVLSLLRRARGGFLP